MRIVVLGAGGGVGRHAVVVARELGHEVVAAARLAPVVPAGVAAVSADVRDADDVRRATAGADAVLWCVGVTARSGGDVGRTAMPYLLAAAAEHGIGRVVTVSGAGVTLPGDDKGPGARLISALTRRLARDLVMDKQGEHDVLAASSLSWTEVRPPRLVDRPGSGRWALVERAPGLTARPVAKVDVARAMVELAGSKQWSRRSPFLVRGPEQ